MSFEPRIIGFLCNWCSYTGADLAGTSRMKYPPNMTSIRVMCSGRIDPGFILHAFSKGADGVLVCGCHPGDCHYVEGNYKCMRRMPLTKTIIEQMGISPKRLRLEWVSASEGGRFQEIVSEFTEQIRVLGPLNLEELEFSGDGNETSDMRLKDKLDGLLKQVELSSGQQEDSPAL